MRSPSGVALLGLCSAYALALVTPPLDSHYLTPAAAPDARPEASWVDTTSGVRAPLRAEYDSTEDVTRISVTTHRGKYFLWIQKPQVRFFFSYPGRTPVAPPSVVYLVFRTQAPQVVHHTRLTWTCNGATSTIRSTPSSWVDQGPMTSSHYLTFKIPTETFVTMAGCASATLEVGGVRAPFSRKQLRMLQELNAALPRAG
jgi:hypothetical protein